MNLETQLTEAYAALGSATQSAHDAAVAEHNAKQALTLRAQAIIRNAADPKELGSNEAARAATIAAMSLTEQDALDAAMVVRREAGNVLTLAEQNVRMVNQIIEIRKFNL